MPFYQILASLPVTLWAVYRGPSWWWETQWAGWAWHCAALGGTWRDIPLRHVRDSNAMGKRWAGGKHQLLFHRRHLCSAAGGTLYWPKVKLVAASIKPFHDVWTHMHLPGSVSGLCKWAGTAGSLKTGAWEEPVSAAPQVCHFKIVTSLKPKRVWLILSRKCSCCGYTTRTFAGVSFPAPISPLSGLALQFSEVSAREVQA